MRNTLLAMTVLLLAFGSGCAHFTESTFMSSLENQDWLIGAPGGPFAPDDVILKNQTAESGYDGARRTFVKNIKLPNENTFDLTRDMFRGVQKAIPGHGGMISSPVTGDERGDFHVEYNIDNNIGFIEFYFALGKDNVLKTVIIAEERPRRVYVY